MNRSYWLEFSENLALFLVGLGAIITLVSDNLLFVILPMIATLILNKLNRTTKERQIYHKTLGKLEHLQSQVWGELQSLQEFIKNLQQHDFNEQVIAKNSVENDQEIPEISSLNSDINTSNTSNKDSQLLIKDYEQYILSLEESLNHVIQYLNQAGINQRFEQIEEYYQNLSNDLAYLTRKLNYNFELVNHKNSQPSQLLLFGQNTQSPTVNLAEKLGENSLINSEETPIKITEKSPTQRELIVNNKPNQWQKITEFSAHENGITDLIISPDNYFIATVSLDQNLKIWGLKNGELLHSNLAHEKGILVIASEIKNSDQAGMFRYILATGGFDYKIKVWEFSTDQIESFNLSLEQTLNGHLGSIRALKFSPDGKLLISGSYDKTIKQWSINDGNLIQNSFDNLSSIQSIALSYDGQIIASGGEGGKIYFWEAQTGVKRGSLSGNNQAVKALEFSGDGQLLVAGCNDGSIKLWRLEPKIFRDGFQAEPTTILTEHFGEIKDVIFSPCGQFLISADIYGTILIWSIEKGEIIETLNLTQIQEGEQIRLLSLSLSKDGQFLVAGDGKGYLTIWQNN